MEVRGFPLQSAAQAADQLGAGPVPEPVLPPEPARPPVPRPASICLSAHRDEEWIRQARDIALDWIESNPRQFRPGREGFAWHPKTAADRAGYLGFVTRTAGCRGLLNSEQARILVRSLNAHGRYLANAAQHQESNFGLFQDVGLLLLSQYLPFEREAERWRELAVRRFPETLMGRLSPSGCGASTPRSTSSSRSSCCATFSSTNPGKRDPALVDTLARMRDATGWFVDPEGEYALLGDTQFAKAPEWGYNKGGSYKSQGLKAFRESGFAMVRQGGSYLATTAGSSTRPTSTRTSSTSSSTTAA